MTIVPAWGGEQTRQSCLSCHPVHFAERGECTGCHLGNPASARQNIAHAGLREGKYARFTLGDMRQRKNGELLLEQFACRRCHISNGRGNRLATNLDAVAKQKTATELASSIRQPVDAMPNFRTSEEQATILVNMILVGSQGQKTGANRPVTIHFNNSKNMGVDLFTRVCGSCHRMLTKQRGAIGRGNIGPNLSGILTPYYPRRYKGDAVWTDEGLKIWLNNPHTVKQSALMQPVLLTKDELKELLFILNNTHE